LQTMNFLEWQEVYPGSYYGTLKSELKRIQDAGKIPIFDVDVVGGLNLKKYFGVDALAVFIQPPSPKELENRLRKRNTDNEESLKKRITKAEHELTFAGQFDEIIVNDDLETVYEKTVYEIRNFIYNRRDAETQESLISIKFFLCASMPPR